MEAAYMESLHLACELVTRYRQIVVTVIYSVVLEHRYPIVVLREGCPEKLLARGKTCCGRRERSASFGNLDVLNPYQNQCQDTQASPIYYHRQHGF
jgi:hypothetical protein